MVKDTRYIIRRVIIGVLIALILGFLNSRKVQALDIYTYNEWQFVYRDNTVGQTWDGQYIYRLGEEKSLLAVNIYFPSFQGFYNGTITFQLDPNQFPSQPNGFLTNQYFKLFVYQNGSYLSDYYVGTCDSKWTCTYNFQGTAEQLSSNRLSLQLLINNEAFSTAYIFYPAARVSANLYVSSDNPNNSNSDLINAWNNSTDEIKKNQDENTDKEIESQKVCKFIDNDSVATPGKFLNSNGSTGTSNSWGITDYIKINQNYTLSVIAEQNSSGAYYCFYKSDKSLVRCYSNPTLSSFTVPDNASFVRFSIRTVDNLPKLNICINGNQAINDFLSDDSEPGVGQFVGELEDIMPSNTPITDLLTLPLTLLTYYLNGFNELCSPFTLGSLLGTNLVIPCIDLEDRLGSNLWNIIDGLCSIFLIYNIAMMCIQIYEAITSFEDPVSIMYQPQHGDTRVNRSRAGGLYD